MQRHRKETVQHITKKEELYQGEQGCGNPAPLEEQRYATEELQQLNSKITKFSFPLQMMVHATWGPDVEAAGSSKEVAWSRL